MKENERLGEMVMKNQTILAKDAPAAVGPYSHAVLADGVLYLSGQLGLDPATGALPETVGEQAEQSLKNLGAVLRAAGMDYCDVVKTTVFLADMKDFAEINEIYARYFQQDPPARSCVQAAALPKGALFEAEAIAVKK